MTHMRNLDFTDTSPSTKFSNGMWWIEDGVTIDWAVEAYKTEQRQEKLYSMMSTKHIASRGDILNSTTISTSLSSPMEDIVMLEATHHKGYLKNEPRFALNKDAGFKPNVSINSESNVSSLSAGDVTAQVNTDGNAFNIKFSDSDKVLTELGFRSLGHVRDLRNSTFQTGPTATYMTAQLSLDVHEKVYGLGERFGPFIKNGQSVDIWNRDGGTSSDQAYKNIPFYLSSKGYGVLVDSSSRVNFEVQSERTTRVNISVPGETIRIYIIGGKTLKDVLYNYGRLTGLPALPPSWSFGLWLTTSFTTNYDIGTISSFIQGMKDRDIPLNVFHFDCFWMKGYQWTDFRFDEDYFGSDPKKMITELKKKFGIKVCVWINTYIAQESELFDEGQEKGYLIKRTDGSVWQTDLWTAGMAVVDLTNPDACKWYRSHLERLLSYGVDSFKTDFGERIPAREVEFFSKEDPSKVHNYYPYLYNKVVFDTLRDVKGENEACVFARSATVGTQQFPVVWGGDCESTFVAMSESLRGGLSISLSGFSFWSHDIGGFEGSPDPAVYKRWCAFGLLSSHSRLHGSGSYRVPWLFGQEACDVLQKFTKLKLSLIPYLYAKAIEAHQRATPVLRASFLEYPEDETAYTCDSQFFLGDNFLVAPVFSGDKGDVRYYLPSDNKENEGQWYGLLDGKFKKAGKWYKETHDYFSLPLYVRPNSVYISGNNDATTEYKWDDNFTANINAIVEPVSAKIPSPEKTGTYSVEVKVVPTPTGLEVKLENGKKVGNWNIRVFGKSLKVVKGDGKISSKDEFGNEILSVKGQSIVLEYV